MGRIDPGTEDSHKNDVATALFFQSIPESLILQVGGYETPKEIWKSIQTRHEGADRVKEARLQTVLSEFERIKMRETDTIDQFVAMLSEISSKAASLGETIDEAKLVQKFLNCLPRNKFIHIIASLEQLLDLKKTTFEDIIGRLKAFEERVVNEETLGDTQEKLLYANSDERNTSSSRGRGRGRGGRGNRGRGRGGRKSNSHERSNQTDSKEKKDRVIICYRCDKPGHFASVCPDRPHVRTQEANKTEL